MTRGRNAPTGWAAFRAFRQVPAPMFERRHGNWRHGDYAQSTQQSRRHLRVAIAALNGRWLSPLPWSTKTAPGWAVFREAHHRAGPA